jgi:N-acyl-phosphatidylethanolamine-hydrolysing phospholipase D
MALLRWMVIERKWRPPETGVDPTAFRRAIPTLGSREAAGLGVTWLGHSTAVVELNGCRFLTDPVWADRVSPLPGLGPRRRVPVVLPLESLPPLDAILLSHNHYDHLDRGTVSRLAGLQPSVPWLVPVGLRTTLRRFGVTVAHELDWWDEITLGSAWVGCTPAMHFSARGLRDRNATLWCGWAFGSGSRRAYFAGDSGYHPDFSSIARRFGPFDLALLPVGAYEPRWFMRPMHMDPEEAIQAYLDLRAPFPRAPAPVMVPIHWGTYRLTDEPMDEPPRRTRQAWEAAGLPASSLWLLAQGETRRVGGETLSG